MSSSACYRITSLSLMLGLAIGIGLLLSPTTDAACTISPEKTSLSPGETQRFTVQSDEVVSLDWQNELVGKSRCGVARCLSGCNQFGGLFGDLTFEVEAFACSAQKDCLLPSGLYPYTIPQKTGSCQVSGQIRWDNTCSGTSTSSNTSSSDSSSSCSAFDPACCSARGLCYQLNGCVPCSSISSSSTSSSPNDRCGLSTSVITATPNPGIVNQPSLFSAQLANPVNCPAFTCNWDFGDGQPTPDVAGKCQGQPHTYQAPGTYTVKAYLVRSEKETFTQTFTYTVGGGSGSSSSGGGQMCTGTRGDIVAPFDGFPDLTDVTTLAGYLRQLQRPYIACADINCNGRLDIDDLDQLFRAATGEQPLPSQCPAA